MSTSAAQEETGHHPARRAMLNKSSWILAGFMASYGLRFALNIILTRLLLPEVMGIMVILNAVRLGIELLTDVGIEQNIVHHADGLTEHFRDAAWTMQVARGVLLSTIFAAAAPFLSHFYHVPAAIFLVASFSPFIGGLHSTAVFVLVRKLEVPLRNMFEVGSEALSFLVSIGLAAALHNVWAPVIALVLSVAIRSALSYLLPEARQRLVIDHTIRKRIMAFGKWIALTSLLMYGASNLDRLYLGRVLPLAVLGIYGVARAIAEIPTSLARRLSYQLVFPALARAKESGELTWRPGGIGAHVLSTRALLAYSACAAIGLGCGIADWAVALVYDPRYAAAGWILAILLTGATFAVLSNLNEALLLAAGRPALGTYANAAKLATLGALLPLCYRFGGFGLAVAALPCAELGQYFYIGWGVRRVGGAVFRQDACAIGIAFATLGLVALAREACGFSLPFAGFVPAMNGH